MAEPLVGMTKSGAAVVGQVVRRVMGRMPDTGRRTRRVPQSDGQRFFGKLASTLAAGSMSAPSSCTFNVWQPDPDSTADPQPWIVTTDENLLGITVINLDPSLTGSSGDFAKIECRFGVWSAYWVGCGA